jgi:manganese oxidase
MIGVKTEGIDEQVRTLLPNYMTMGSEGMGDMGTMGMQMPPNSVPMVGGEGPHDYITMGGMFTILKVRESLPQGYDVDPGWYVDRPGELASLAPADVLRQNGIAADGSNAPKPPFPPTNPYSETTPTRGNSPHGGHGGHKMSETPTTAPSEVSKYTCPMHPEVIEDALGKCPKCGMKLVPKKG